MWPCNLGDVMSTEFPEAGPEPVPGPDRATYGAAAELLRALAHPARLRIAIELGSAERCVHELVELLDLSQPTVSQHLQVLRGARVVTGRRAGREVRYSLVDHHIAHIAGDAVTHAGEPHRHDPPDTLPDDSEQHEPPAAAIER